jgi:hypothetical protein
LLFLADGQVVPAPQSCGVGTGRMGTEKEPLQGQATGTKESTCHCYN